MELADWAFPNWTLAIGPLFATIVVGGMEILARLVPFVYKSLGWPEIAVKGKHLDRLEYLDNVYITINKLLTVAFVYHLVYVCYYTPSIGSYTPSIEWSHEKVNIQNTLGSLSLFYLFYDFFYMNFHRFLHIQSLYPLVHKHHHRQKAPSRGNYDAINVHPFEFVVGEYLHLLTVYCIPCHIYTVLFFILAGGILASLNHTRFDVHIPYLFCVKVHDVHHRLPQSNYAQYTMLWDTLFGTFRDYDLYTPKD